MVMNTREIVKKYGIKLVKSLGQNFLIDDDIVDNIVNAAQISTEDLVLEIGPGIGNMTSRIAAKAGRVIAIEIDKHLIPALTENLKDYSNITIVNEDVLKVNITQLLDEACPQDDPDKIRSIKVVANLPYYITTPIIMKFLEEYPQVDSMVFMVQKEVAERMTAKPGGKDYGALSIAVQYYSAPKKMFNVPPQSFIPKPEVDSTVIKLDIFKEPPVMLKSKELFFKTIKASFGQRRKTLVNALSNSGYYNVGKEEIKKILNQLGIDENRRGETLSIEQFAELSNLFFEIK